MDTTKTTEAIDQERRRLLGTAVMGIAVAGTASLLPSQLAAATAGEAIRPFSFHASEAKLADLRRRINATQWPEQETVADESQGVRLATMQNLARYWATDYDWRKIEAKLNALPTVASAKAPRFPYRSSMMTVLAKSPSPKSIFRLCITVNAN